MSLPLAPSTSLTAVSAATTPSSPGLNLGTRLKCTEPRSPIRGVECRDPFTVAPIMERSANESRSATSERPPSLRLLAPLAASLALMPFAVSIRYTGDFGLAYGGGVEAWASGHPERVTTWFSTPFLALVMAVITRLGSEQVTAHVF